MSSITGNKMVSENLWNEMPQVSAGSKPGIGERVRSAKVQRLTPPKNSPSLRRLTMAPRAQLRSATAGLSGFLGWIESRSLSHKSKLDFSCSIKVTVKDAEKSIPFSGRSLAAMFGDEVVADKAALACRLELMQKRAENGRQLLKEILSGGPMPLATTECVADLMLYLRCAAAANGEDFERGAFSVEDPKGRLYGFLDGCKKAYARSSTHLGKLQRMWIDGHMNTQRGIDLPVGANGMPGKIRTILYGAIPDYNGQARRIFIKPETHGCFLNKPRDIGRSSRFHGNRGYRFGDVKESICHGMSLIKTKGAKIVNYIKSLRPGKDLRGVDPLALPARRESLPDAVKFCFKNLTDAVAASGTTEGLLHILQKDEPLKAHAGIRTMLRNLDEAREKCPKDLEHFQPLVDSLMRQFEAVDSRHSLHARIGNEVMLNLDEII